MKRAALAENQSDSSSLTNTSEQETPKRGPFTEVNRGFADTADDVSDTNEEIWALRKAVKTLKSEAESLNHSLLSAENYRKLLQSHILDLKGPIKVYCRVKSTASERQIPIGFPEKGVKSLSGEERFHAMWVNFGFSRLTFTCDRIFPENTPQAAVFTELSDYIQSAIDGEHLTIFTYGGNSSGKRFTYEGNTENVAELGVIPRAAEYVFEGIRKQAMSTTLRVLVSCLAVTRDVLTDLISAQNHKLTIKTLGGKIVVDLLSWHEVSTPQELMHILQAAKPRKSTTTASHILYQIVLEGSDISGRIIEGQVNFVGLAEAGDEGTMEAIKRVVGEKGRGGTGVAAACRESVLTRVLQDSLESISGKVVLFTTISSDEKQASASRETLKYAYELQSGLLQP